MRITPMIPLSNAYNKERKANYIDRKNPMMKIIALMNKYHAINSMYATNEEKEWAKSRLEKQIRGLLHHVGTAAQGAIKASFKNLAVWENTRNEFG